VAFDRDEWIARNTRPVSCLRVGGARPSLREDATHFGLRPLGYQDEMYPLCDGEPMQFICQLNLKDAPFVPPVLSDLALVTFFAADPDRFIRSDQEDGTWCIRGYTSADELVQLPIPAFSSVDSNQRWLQSAGKEAFWDSTIATSHSGHEGRWWPDDPADVPEDFDPSTIFDVDGYDPNEEYRTKIGGFPAEVQHGVGIPNGWEFAFQIDSEQAVGLEWVDQGFVYCSRNPNETPENQWFVECQFL
jgi:Domain of unknown function (DUF1963)